MHEQHPCATQTTVTHYTGQGETAYNIKKLHCKKPWVLG